MASATPNETADRPQTAQFFSRFTQSLRHHLTSVTGTIGREARELRNRWQLTPTRQHTATAPNADQVLFGF